MPFAAALSEHPVAAVATGEVAGELLDRLGPVPDLVVAFVTGHHREVFGDVVAALRTALAPTRLLAATAVSVLAGEREVEEHPAISVWGARFSSGAAVAPLRLDALRTADGVVVLGLDPTALVGAAAVLLVADPASFPTDELVAALRREAPGVPVVGGVASAGVGPGANLLALDGQVHDDGAVGVVLPAGAAVVDLIVSQGCRPVGSPLTVTRSEANVVAEIAGVPATERLREALAGLDGPELELARRGLHVGRVVDEHRIDLERGDFLVRNLVGIDAARGSIAVNDLVEVGSTVQFQVRDAAAADEDLRELLDGHVADAALVFTCNGRGSRFFGAPDHDAELVTSLTGSRATAGMFCAGEIGPVGGRPFLHGFTASIALFRDG
ncbi:MAG: FIST N-terminal domain-containing protein [Acidimicrobiales bacterium]